MTEQEIRRLNKGDIVYWTDPDEGKCSRHVIIQTIRVSGEVVSISDREGDFLECLAEELENEPLVLVGPKFLSG